MIINTILGLLLIFVLFKLFQISQSIKNLSEIIRNLRFETPEKCNFSKLEFQLQDIQEELEKLNYYRDYPDGNYYEHKRRIALDTINNPGTFDKLIEVENRIKTETKD